MTATVTLTDASLELTHRITQLLYHEAQLLDEARLVEWLELVTEDVTYRVPVRIHKEQTDATRVTGVQTNSFHLDEDRTSLQMRVDRIETGFAWAEEPPSRIRHMVTNVRVQHAPHDLSELEVRSYVAVHRSRWDKPAADLMTAERFDTWREDRDGSYRLASRWVVLDSTTVPMMNISFFF